MKSVSILGLGWLGWPLAQNFASQGWQVKGTVRNIEKAGLQRISSVKVLTFDFPVETRNLPELLKSDVLIITIPPSKVGDYLELIQFLKNQINLTQIKQVIFTGSTSVYPDCSAEVDETTKELPNSQGGKTLLDAEKLLLELSCTTTILRLGGLFGENRNPGKFLAGKEDLPNPDGMINLVEGCDVIAIVTALAGQENQSEVYNVCNPKHPSRKAFYTKAAIELNLKPPVFVENEIQEWKLVKNTKIQTRLPNFRFKDLPL